jgi:hypothetical protein
MGNYGTHPEKLKPVTKIRQFFDFSQEFFTVIGHMTTNCLAAMTKAAKSAYQFVNLGKKPEKCLISVTHEMGDCNMMEL